VRARARELLVKATVHPAIRLHSLATEMLKMQFDYARIVEVGPKVMRAVGLTLRAKDSISHSGGR